MSEFTKGKLAVSDSCPNSIYVLQGGKANGLFATCDAGDYARGIKEGNANAKEVVYRWNEYPTLKQQRDDLLAACKEALPLIAGERITFDAIPPTDHLTLSLSKNMSKCEKSLIAAIAKCEA